MESIAPGPAARAAQLNEVLESVQRVIPYLRATAGTAPVASDTSIVPDDGALIACDALIDDAEWLKMIITKTGDVLGTDDPMVAASLFIQSYSYRVLTLAIACATTSGVVPDSSASSMAIGLKNGRVSLVAYTEPTVLVLKEPSRDVSLTLRDPAQMALLFDFTYTRAIEQHLARLIDSTRSSIRVGERLLWGNVAASMAVAFRTMEGCLGDWVQDAGNYFVSHSPAPLQGLGSFLVLERGERRGWFWERTNCCLYDRLPGNIRCSDCSRTPIDAPREAYRATLDPS